MRACAVRSRRRTTEIVFPIRCVISQGGRSTRVTRGGERAFNATELVNKWVTCIKLILYLLWDNVVHKTEHTLYSIIISNTNTSPERASKQYVIMSDKSKVKSDHLHLQNHRPVQINNCSAQEREGGTRTAALAAERVWKSAHISLRLPSRRAPLTRSKASIEREVSEKLPRNLYRTASFHLRSS